MVLSDDLISIMDKPVKERTPEEQQAYIAYLEGAWTMADNWRNSKQKNDTKPKT